ncbi:MAG: MFS transporter [Kordiimonadaceae bacterium]|nr:MFS transporter [Kordiimonadaceae bacterium]
MQSRAHIAVFVVYSLAFFGIALPYPVVTPMFLNGDISSGFSPEVALGIVMAVYPLGLFFGGGTLGSLSDQYGRRPVLIGSLILTTLGILWSAYAIWTLDFPQLVLSRLITGFFEANGSIARAMLIDMEKGEATASSFALLSVGAYGGYLLGPVLGGYLAQFGNVVPFLAAGFFGFTALSLAFFWLPETNAKVVAGGKQAKRLSIYAMLKSHVMFRQLLLAHFLLTVGINTFYQFYPMFLVKRWAANPAEIALTNMFFTAAMIAFALFGVPRLEFLPLGRKLMVAGAIFSVLLLSLLLAPTNAIGIVVSIFIGFAVSVMNASSPAFLSRETKNTLEQGAVMGALTSSFCLSQVFISLVGSRVAVGGIELTFLLGSLAALLGVVQVQRVRGQSRTAAL